MQIVIKIDKEAFTNIKVGAWQRVHSDMPYKAIKNGTPLPKCHGRLMILSEDAVKREQCAVSFSRQKWISEVGLSNATAAIIEANKAESEEINGRIQIFNTES